MIERFIFTALKEGIAYYTADPNRLTDLFKTLHSLPDAEFSAIKTYFKDHPPDVVHGYAHATHKFPLYAIVLANEGESINFLGDDAGMVADPDDPDYRADVLSAVWDHQHDIYVYAEHPDVALYYYEMAKAILMAAQDYFNEQGVFGQKVSGMDMAPDPRYIPENLFVRRLTFKSQREFAILDKDVRRGFKVTGIYVDSSGSLSDVGGVSTKVTTYAVGEE